MRNMKKDKRREINNVFYTCVSKPLVVYRFIGLLPIEGLLNPDGYRTRYTIKSLYIIYLGIVLCIQTMCLVLIYYCLMHKEKTIVREPSEVIGAMSCFMVCISLFHLCKNWTPNLRKIEYIEMLLPPLRSHKIFIHRIKWFISLMLLICLVEYFAHILYTILIVKHCFLLEDDSGWYLKSYFLASNAWFYHHISFSYASGFITQVFKDSSRHMLNWEDEAGSALTKTFLFATVHLNKALMAVQIVKTQAIVMCHLADIVIMVITVYLTCRVRNFYGCLLQTIKRKPRKEASWHELQRQFTSLTTLVSTVDNLISPFIFSSFLSHLLFICKQLYQVIQKNRTDHFFQKTECVFHYSHHPITLVSFSLSLGSILLRSSMVSLTTAQLHTLSRKPLDALHFVPTSMYDYDMQRLMDQVYHSKIGLSGLRIFYVTRGTILSMISTILTYELILLQIKV